MSGRKAKREAREKLHYNMTDDWDSRMRYSDTSLLIQAKAATSAGFQRDKTLSLGRLAQHYFL